jgi:hypothetical protein
MIRLTLNVQSEPEIHHFDQSSIVIGSSSNKADLLLDEEGVRPIHLKIFEQNGFVIALNEANDPFASINGQPFGKKLLNSGDIILVGHTTILFENIPSPQPESGKSLKMAASNSASTIVKPCEDALTHSKDSSTNLPSPFKLPFEPEVEALSEEEFAKESVERYLEELEAQQLIGTPNEASTISSQDKRRASLKDDDHQETNDDDHAAPSGPVFPFAEHSHLYQAWRWIIFFIFSATIISMITGSIIYLSVSDKTEAQESKAAQAVADVAMALTYSKLHHLKPHNQNWSDPEFLKNSLKTVLPDSPSYASKIDSQGQFHSCPYTLRIYTNADLSHFLLIAQPAPNLLYWLLPQPMVVVDSKEMELRAYKDIRSLNRLLANPNPLEGINGDEITNLIKQGELISLSSIATESGNSEFAPPKNLSWIIPGAENLIYNAPRYYRLGQQIVKHAISLSTNKSTSQEVADFKKEVQKASSLNQLILYSDQGKKSAVLARKSISMFAPGENLLFGYLLYNSQGKVNQVHLLGDEEDGAGTIAAVPQEEEMLAFENREELTSGENAATKPLSQVDRNHPVYIQLQSIATARHNELKPLIAAIFKLVNQELASPQEQFQIEYQNLSHAFLMANAKHKRILRETLETLYEKYEDLPIHEFFAFLQDLELDQLMHKGRQSLTVVDENLQMNMNSLLSDIDNSQTLDELNHVIHTAVSWLNFDYIKDPHELMKYQNDVRNKLLEQLERCLLTQNSLIEVKPEDLEILQDILNQERLIKPEERDFFSEEFETQFQNL